MSGAVDADAVAAATSASAWDKVYERKAVALLAVGFGLVGLDRFILNPLFPVMAEDLGLDYQDLGLISGILALTWGISSVFSGNLADRIGGKRVLITSVLLFSALVAFSGLAVGLISLLIIRGLMGLAEGGFVPASIVETVRASKPSRIGLNVGLQQMAMPLVGLGLGPLIAVALLSVLPSWEYVFGVVAIPGFIVAWLMSRVLRDAPSLDQAADEAVQPSAAQRSKPTLFAPFAHGNVLFGTIAMIFFISCLITLATFMPSYLTDYMQLSMEEMGAVLAVLGGGGVVGMIVIPAISDRFGRKPVMLGALIIELVMFAVLLANQASGGPVLTALCLFLISIMNSGVVAIIVGPLINMSVPATMAATATGLAVGLGEALGGAVAPAIAGALANAVGIQSILYVTFGATAVGFLVVLLGIREPAKLPLPEGEERRGEPASTPAKGASAKGSALRRGGGASAGF
ncbi:MAG: MFS transporter [Pseudomonadota bacterium]